MQNQTQDYDRHGRVSGIGAGVTKAFLKHDYNVVATARKITESEFAPTDRS